MSANRRIARMGWTLIELAVTVVVSLECYAKVAHRLRMLHFQLARLRHFL